MFREGFHGDCAATFLVGDVYESGRDLVSATKKALNRAISQCGPGKPIDVIGRVEFEVIFYYDFLFCINF